ncbi:hypothetical protein RhiJN_18091 [Ceratobasidium sp. AG-Ba]|nr:hypothetical protein RhiJN_18091 [Ceratobasidium sp. AG-Ba]
MIIPEASGLELRTSSLIINRTLAETEPQYARTKTISTQITTRTPYLYRSRDMKDLNGLIASGEPICSLHITYLKDATIFALTFAHLIHGKGYQAIIGGLFLELDGQPLPPLLGRDPWSVILPEALESSMPQTGVVWDPESILRMQQEALDDTQATGPLQTRTIYFPAHEIIRLKHKAMSEIREAKHSDIKWLSTSDVLAAWIYQHCYTDLPNNEGNTRFIHPINCRKYFPEAFPPDCTYLHNTILVASAKPLTVRQLQSMSFGEIARFVRLPAVAHSAREPLLSNLKANYEHQGQLYMPIAPGECMHGTSSWLSFNFGELSIVKHIKPGSGSGRVVEVIGDGIGKPPCTLFIKFKDIDGGIVCEMDWGAKRWTSGEMLRYAMEMQEPAPSDSSQLKLRARL